MYAMKFLLVLGILLLTGCANNRAQTQADLLAEADARQIALEKAGVENAVFTKQQYDADDSAFEFEFYTSDQSYECEINARNGKIKDFSVEKRYEVEELSNQ